MTKPATLKLQIYQGATFRRRLRWLNPDKTPIDLTGCTARMQVREEVESTAVLLELTTENDRLVLGGTAGTVDLLVDASTTATITWSSGVHDLEIVHPGGEVTRLAEGSCCVSPEVTRD
ncbi:hypothetical protein [Delftia acidovorans]|uniref:hypothetical protein n=1 Tax=Delftia acidovorans TaxID=80866 RepID=UPI000BC8C992|nr:hypothetical protein [Delftia acidovorans]SOE35305.1 hypothetical protein SAMN05216519_1285 [Delftia acidovorans]